MNEVSAVSNEEPTACNWDIHMYICMLHRCILCICATMLFTILDFFFIPLSMFRKPVESYILFLISFSKINICPVHFLQAVNS